MKTTILFINAFIISIWLLGEVALANIPKDSELVDAIDEFFELEQEYRSKADLERKIRASLYEIDQSIKNLNFKITQIDANLLLSQSKAERTAKDLIELERQIFQHQKRLLQHLQISKGIRSEQKLKLFIGSKDLKRNQRLLRQFKLLSAREADLIQEIHSLIQKSKEKKQRLDELSRTILAQKADLKIQEKSLQNEQNKKITVSKRVRENKKIYGKRLLELKRSSPLLLQLSKQSFVELKGGLSYPVSSNPIANYGLVQTEPYGVHFAQKGIFFDAQENSPVLSVGDGEIIWTGALKGLGFTMIVSHGDNYYSVYSGLKKPEIENPTAVQKSQPIGVVSSQPSYVGQGLYFELRHYSDSIDPTEWFEKPQLISHSHHLPSETQ